MNFENIKNIFKSALSKHLSEKTKNKPEHLTDKEYIGGIIQFKE